MFSLIDRWWRGDKRAVLLTLREALGQALADFGPSG
jgi:hypothetical protein